MLGAVVLGVDSVEATESVTGWATKVVSLVLVFSLVVSFLSSFLAITIIVQTMAMAKMAKIAIKIYRIVLLFMLAFYQGDRKNPDYLWAIVWPPSAIIV